MEKYYTYVMTNKGRTTLYVGVTNNLERRIAEHKSDVYSGFTQRYKLHVLVYYEEYGNVDDALHREKQLKRWSRAKKNALVETLNPLWKDLTEK